MVVELLEGLGVGFLLENRGKFSSTKVSSSIFFFFPSSWYRKRVFGLKETSSEFSAVFF